MYYFDWLDPTDIRYSHTPELIMNNGSAPVYCTEVPEYCPIQATIYGSAPSLTWNILFLTIFLLSAVIHAGQGIYYRMWTFLVAMFVGGKYEVAGKFRSLQPSITALPTNVPHTGQPKTEIDKTVNR